MVQPLLGSQANAGDFVKWHIDHAAHAQPIVVGLTVFHHGRTSADLKGNIQLEILHAVRPTLLTTRGLLIAISSPYPLAQEGIMRT